MPMREAIFIICSDEKKTDRFCGSGDVVEWVGCWEFDDNKDIVLCWESDGRCSPTQQLTIAEAEEKVVAFDRMICWIKGWADGKERIKKYIASFEKSYFAFFYHDFSNAIPDNLSRFLYHYSLGENESERWKSFVDDGKDLAKTSEKKKIDDFFRKYFFTKILGDLKFPVVQLCLRVEGLKKCFEKSTEDEAALSRYEESLRKFHTLYGDVLNRIHEIKKTLADRISDEIKESLDDFFEHFGNITDITGDKLNTAKVDLCKILISLEERT
jgi:hypothetical protein